MDNLPKKDFRIQYPKLQTVAFSEELIELCNGARTTSEDTVIFDLSMTEFITPFGIILLSGAISECLSLNKRALYATPNREKTRDFLSGIGFYEFFKLTGEIHKIESPNVQLRRLSSIDYQLTDQILAVFEHWLNMSEGVKGSLKMALNELMMNVFDHSESTGGCYVCAQSYRTAKKIRLCIADFGIGILKALKKNPLFTQLKYDVQAIMKSIEEGVTSRGSGVSGFGLTHINRFMEVNKGKMYILSRYGKVSWDFSEGKKKVNCQSILIPFQGTIVKLEINAGFEGYYFLKSEDGNIF